MHFEFAYFHFVLIHLELKRKIRSYTPVVPSKPDSGACEFASKLSSRLFSLPLTAPGSFFSTFADLKDVIQPKVEEETDVSEAHDERKGKCVFFPLVFFPFNAPLAVQLVSKYKN